MKFEKLKLVDTLYPNYRTQYDILSRARLAARKMSRRNKIHIAHSKAVKNLLCGAFKNQ